MKTIVLTILIFLTSQSHALIINCNNYWQAYGANGNYPCEEYQPQNFPGQIDGVAYRFFHYSQNWDGSQFKLLALDNIAEALKEIVQVYKKYGTVKPTYFILTNNEKPGGSAGDITYASADTHSRGVNDPCPVFIYPAALNYEKAKFKQAIAHELFHCFQFDNMRAQIVGPVNTAESVWNATTGWWAEGSANFFSNLVYPTVNLEYSTQPFYDAKVPLHLQKNSYSVSSFFQAAANASNFGGPAHIINFIKATPAAGDATKQLNKLSGAIDFSSIFHDFSIHLQSDDIQDSGGGPLPTAYLGEVTSYNIEGADQVFTLPVKPMTVPTFQFNLEPGHKYTFEGLNEGMFTIGARASLRRTTNKAWLPLSMIDQSFDLSCSSSIETIEVVLTRTENTLEAIPTELTVHVEKKPCPCKTDFFKPDACLVGKWELDNSIFKQLFEIAVPNVDYKSTTGKLFINVSSTGKIEFNFESLNNSVIMPVPMTAPMLLEIIFKGQFVGKMGVSSAQKVCVIPESDGTEVISRVHLDDTTVVESVSPNPLSNGSSQESESSVTCTPTLIHYDIKLPPQTEQDDPMILSGTMIRVQQ